MPVSSFTDIPDDLYDFLLHASKTIATSKLFALWSLEELVLLPAAEGCTCLVSGSCPVCSPVLALYALPSQHFGVSAFQASGRCLCLAGQGKSVCINTGVVLDFFFF